MRATSPYLNAAARRASIQIVPLRAPVYATTAEFPQRYARARTDGLPLEKTPPLEPYWKSAVGLLGMIVFAVAATFLAWAVT